MTDTGVRISRRSPSRDRLLRPSVLASLAFAIGVAVSIYLHFRLEAEDRRLLERRITIAVNSRVRAIEAAARSYEDCLNALRTLFTYSEEVSREEFARAARALIARYPGIAALEWAPLVDASERAEFELQASADLGREVIIRDRISTTGLSPAGVRPEYLPVQFIEPLGPNLRAHGFDLFAGRSRTQLELARTRGVSAMAPITPVILSGTPASGLIVYVPTYDELPDPPALPAADAFRGFVLGVFRLDRFFADAPGRLGTVGYEFLVIDHTERNPDGVIALHRDDDTTQTYDLPDLPGFLTPESRSARLQLWQRDWELVFRPTPAWLATASRRHPYLLLLLGVFSSGVLSLLIHHRLRYTTSIEKEVAERTLQLRATQQALEADIRHRTEVEHALAASEERYRAFVNQSAEAIWRLELNPPLPIDAAPDVQVDHLRNHARLAECNHALARMYGHASESDVTGKTWEELKSMDTESRDCMTAFVATGYRLQEFECHQVDANGRTQVFLRSMIGICEQDCLVRVWGMQREITAQREAEAGKASLERKMLETQKLESLGVLAGGIAHDFNNLLTGIMGNASLVAYELPANSRVQIHLRQIDSATTRAAELCQQMLAYSGRGRFLVEPIDLGQLIRGTVPLLGLSISKSVRLHFALDADLPGVVADATQMRQVIMNLVINASDAIGDRMGDVTLATGVMWADAAVFERAALSPSLPAGEYVFVEVRDTGAGMTPETQSRIFDPFFTTKFAGRGLGLAAALGIARGHHGALLVDSTPGRGTTFRLLLPKATTPSAPAASSSAVPGPNLHQHWAGRILLVDDEEPVRFVGAHMLQTFGFEVETVSDGSQALKRFEQPDATFELVLLDLTMPGIGGEEVLRQLRARRPDIRVLLMSGYSQQEVSQRIGESPTAFIQKPFSVESMRRKLFEVLGQPGRAPTSGRFSTS